jgi:chaperone modulatory protein CbpM
MERHEFLMHAAIEGEVLETWLEAGWLASSDVGDAGRFTDVDLARARLICDLQRGLGVNDEAVPIILHLLDQVHGLRRMIAEARRRAAADPPAD